MSKKIVLVGHCGPDSSFLRMAVSSAQKGLSVVSADDEQSLGQAVDQPMPNLAAGAGDEHNRFSHNQEF